MGTRVAHYGFPSVHPDAVSEDLTRIDTDHVPEKALAILDYFYKKRTCRTPASVKTSKVKKPDPAQGKAAVNDDDHETDSVSNADADHLLGQKKMKNGFSALSIASLPCTSGPPSLGAACKSLIGFLNNLLPTTCGVTSPSLAFKSSHLNWVTTRKHSVWQAYQAGVLNAFRERTRAQALGNLNSHNS
ncbi:hypothetical protein RSAG8_12531, partial [Rhizoctonia solani AG-8 WAC10335]